MSSFGVLNVHSTNSLKKSAALVQDICTRAKDADIPAVALADHGIMTGLPSFVKAAKKNGIKPVLGVTLLIKGQTTESELCIYAKNIDGYQAMVKSMKITNENMRDSGADVPFANINTLVSCFGPGTSGYNNVYAVSSGMTGVIGSLVYEDERRRKRISELETILKKAEQGKVLLAENQNRLKEVETQIKELDVIVKQKTAPLKKEVEKSKGGFFYVETKARLDAMEAEIADAKEKIKYLKNDKTAISKQITINKKNIPVIDREEDEYQKLIKSVYTPEQMASIMERVCLQYEKLFGKGNFVLELQYHGDPTEKTWMPVIDRIAQKNDILTTASCKVYMAGNTEKDIMGYETILGLADGKADGFKKLSSVQKKHYMMQDEELKEQLKKVLKSDRVDKALDGIRILVDNCNVEFPEHPKHYPVFDKNENAYKLLLKEVEIGKNNRFPDGFPDSVYQDRLDYELSVIKKMNVCDYHLIVQDLTRFGRKLGHMPEKRYLYLRDHIVDMEYDEIVKYVDEDQSRVGYTVGPGRGSSAGSLVCYLINITDIDPIKYDLLFERYLNPERATMPDIDMDFANGYRDVIVWYTYKRYGQEAVCRIVTFSTLKPKVAIKDVARQMGDTLTGEILSGVVSNRPGTTFASSMRKLNESANGNHKKMEIVDRASSVENAYRHYGMHAAGVVISDNDNVGEYLPLMWDTDNNQWKSQYDMVLVEEFGLLKMDYLGLKNLNMITEMLRLVDDRWGVKINPNTDIKEEAKVIRDICASGQTNGVFQLESSGMKETEKKLKPDCFEDLILLVAAYRPGPMDSIPEMIRVKHGGKPNYRHEALKPILEVTYGSLIYQEQVQQVFRQLAGYSYGRADLVRRAMSKKKEKEFLAEKPVFIHGDPQAGIVGCVGNGIPEDVASDIFDDMVSFAAYAFNKSHAAAYARISYMLAWFKYHYPTEFYTVALEWGSEDQKIALTAECKAKGIGILPVSINCSEEAFSVEEDKVRFSITSVKGIGAAAAGLVEERKRKPYKSLQDFMLRAKVNKSTTESLIKVGAFDCFCKNRRAVMLAYQEMAEPVKEYLKYDKERQNIEKYIRVFEEIDRKKDSIDGFNADYVSKKIYDAGYKKKESVSKEKFEKQLVSINAKLKDLSEDIEDIEYPLNIEEDIEKRLLDEKECTGLYISGHPLDAYYIPPEHTDIVDLVKDKYDSICGVISNLEIRQRRSDGAGMAFFDLEDKTGVIHTVCFTKPFLKYSGMLENGKAVSIKGRVTVKETADDDENTSETLEMILSEVYPLHHATKRVIYSVPCVIDWEEKYHDVEPFVDDDGEYSLWLHDMTMNEIRNTGLHVKAGIKNLPGIMFG